MAAIFKLEHLKNYQILGRPGTFVVTVAYNVTYSSLYTEDDHPRFLIPLRVVRAEDLPKLVSVLNNKSVVPYKSIADFFLTGALFLNDNNYLESELPAKGEKILATFDTIDDSSTLYCTNVKLIDRQELNFVNLNAVDELYQLAEKYFK